MIASKACSPGIHGIPGIPLPASKAGQLLLALCLLFLGVSPAAARSKAEKPAPAQAPPARSKAIAPTSIARVNVTGQPYDFFRPWGKRQPHQRRAVGPVVEGPFGRAILITGEVVANATYVEVEKADSGEKTPGKILAVDYEANLALVQPNDPAFLKPLKPLGLAESDIGDTLAIWQLEPNGTLLSTTALLTAAEVASYPADDTALLLYRITSALQPREGNFAIPVVRKDKLTGIVIRFDTRTQNADAIPAPVIAHFLEAVSRTDHYTGFPRAGLSIAPLRDPQLRRYAQAPAGHDGVYVTRITPKGPAEKAGLQVGDVLLSVDGRTIDHDGNYDDPRYGKISLIHLLSTLHHDGDTFPIAFMRKGDKVTADLTLATPNPRDSIIEPYVIDRAPRFAILGGLIFQELSRQYLKEWGTDWAKKAPDRLVYLDQFQEDLLKDDPRERIVILSRVLPSPLTIGYEELSSLIVTDINGHPLRSLADLDDALAKSTDGFHRIRFSDAPGEIALDASEVKAIESELMRIYGLPSLKQIDESLPGTEPPSAPAPTAKAAAPVVPAVP